MKLYTEQAVNDLAHAYEEAGGTVTAIKTSVFNSGVIVMEAHGYKTAIINTRAIWNRLENDLKGYAYTVRRYNSTPKKYARALEIFNNGAEAYANEPRPEWAWMGALTKALDM